MQTQAPVDYLGPTQLVGLEQATVQASLQPPATPGVVSLERRTLPLPVCVQLEAVKLHFFYL